MKIKKILIANRGEIAIRIIRTCKEMGIKTVALCPQKGQEGNFLETKFADEYYFLNAEGILGYLDQKKILGIAKKAGADAIHPGYGFLAENGDFADLCRKNEIKFIGPKGEVLRKLGNKIEARKIAKLVGCPLLPASEKPVKDEKECLKAAKKIGIPFLLKASSGGGGLGIEMIDSKDKNKLLATFQKLKREIKNAFGSDDIFVEKFLPGPRHIEFQILGDGKGKVIHFGERECSIQRRHQKLIEEAPSPFLDKGLRKKMGKLAVKIGERLNYEGLGTVEFLADKDKRFYFMEINPRIQVEHPVTELVTGFDLVEQQIKIAGGEKLNLKQKDIKFSGWAMEFRINSEEPRNNFCPVSGTVSKYSSPGGKGIEMHSFCQDGQEIFPYFDNLIAKLVVFGNDRISVIKRARRAFDELIIEGVPTLIPLYKIILRNKNFIGGHISTSFIEKEKIVESLKADKPEKKAQTANKEISKKEIAFIAAHLYQKIKNGKEGKTGTNKWRLSLRQSVLEDENIR